MQKLLHLRRNLSDITGCVVLVLIDTHHGIGGAPMEDRPEEETGRTPVDVYLTRHDPDSGLQDPDYEGCDVFLDPEHEEELELESGQVQFRGLIHVCIYVTAQQPVLAGPALGDEVDFEPLDEPAPSIVVVHHKSGGSLGQLPVALVREVLWLEAPQAGAGVIVGKWWDDEGTCGLQVVGRLGGPLAAHWPS